MKKTKDLLQGETTELTEALKITSVKTTPLLTRLLENPMEANGPVVSWRNETLDATIKTGNLEGSDAVAATMGTRSTITNNCQIVKKTASISGTLKATKVNGISDELAVSVANRLAEAKIEGEQAIITGAKADESGATPRQMNGFLNLVQNVVDVSNVGGTGIGTLTIDSFEEGLKKMYDHNAVNGTLACYCNSTMKSLLKEVYKKSKTGNYEDGGSKTLGFTVDYITTDYGTLEVIMDNAVPAETILGLNMDEAKLRELRPIHSIDLVGNEDSVGKQIIWEFTAELTNIYAGFKITGIKTA